MMNAYWTRAVFCLLGIGLVVSGSYVQGESERSNSQVEIRQVEVRLSDHGPVVLLKAEDRVIPIFVDATVAGSIQAALTGQKLSRPLSHDLMRTILDSFGGKVTQTVITLKDGVFRGTLTVVMNDKTKVFDGRSSDAIALAVHFKAPIMVGRDMLDSTGKTMPDSKTMTL
jgi:uncharacterized protein